MVKYSGTNIEIATIKGPVQVPLEIGGVTIKPQLLQVAGQILQILDWLQFSGCQRIHELKKLKNIPQKTIAELILRQDEDARMIAKFAIVIMAACNSPKNFEEVLADWIAAGLPRARQWIFEDSKIDFGDIEEIEEIQNRSKSLENQIKSVDEEIRNLTAQLKEMHAHKRQLEKKKDTLRLLSKGRLMYPSLLGLYGREIPFRAEWENKLSEAISVFPYLSQAISKKEPFDVRKSVKALMRKT